MDSILMVLAGGVVGFIVGHFLARWFMKRFLSDNGPTNPDSTSADRRDTF